MTLLLREVLQILHQVVDRRTLIPDEDFETGKTNLQQPHCDVTRDRIKQSKVKKKPTELLNVHICHISLQCCSIFVPANLWVANYLLTTAEATRFHQ